METTILFAISVLMSLIVWNKISTTYFWPQLKDMELKSRAAYPVFTRFPLCGLVFSGARRG